MARRPSRSRSRQRSYHEGPPDTRGRRRCDRERDIYDGAQEPPRGGRRRDRGSFGDGGYYGGLPEPPAAPGGPAAWGYNAYGAPPSYGLPPGYPAYWDAAYGAGGGGGDERKGGMDKDRKRKKKKKRRSASSDSSSSSSSSLSDWRQKVWNQGWQGMWPQMWPGWPQSGGPGMPGGPPGMPGMPGGMPPGGMSSDPHQQQRQGRSSPPPADIGSSGRDSSWEVARRSDDPPPTDVPIFLEPAIEEFVPVPKALLGKIIGKQAQTIIEIREKSGAFKVDARDQTSDPCQVKVAGTAEAVKKAREIIMELLDSTKAKHENSDYVEVPRAKVGMVIGLKGAQVNEIQMQTNTKIDVDFQVDPCRCYIKGEPVNVERAKQVLLTIAMQIEDDRSEYLDLPKAASGALIGAAGSRIREFQEQTGARIDIDKTGHCCRVRLSGTADQVANAKALVMYQVENAVPPQQQTRPHAILGVPPPPQPMQIPAHQPSSFPTTLAESIARAKAAAEAIKNGLITGNEPPGGDQSGQAPFSPFG